MTATSTQQIYGNVTTGFDTTQCCTSVQPTVSPILLLQQLVAMIENMKTAIEKFYPPSSSVSIYIGQLATRAYIPFVVAVRLKWIEVYGKQTILNEQGETVEVTRKFDTTSEVHRLQLKDLYLAVGQDWRTDPMFIKMGLV